MNPWEAYGASEGAGPWSDYGAPAVEAPKEAKPVPAKIGQAGFADALKSELAGRSGLEKTLGGVGAFMDDAAYRAKQLTGGDLTPEETARIEQNRELTKQSGHALAGNILGNVAATAVPGAALFSGATRLAGAVLPTAASYLASTLGGAASGATQAALTQPVLEGESTGKNMGIGAIGGAVGDTVVRGLSRVVQPIIQSAPVQALLGQGVVPTPGQAAGANSIWGRVEQKLQSIPLIGDIIRTGRDRAGNEFNAAALARATPAGSAAPQGVGRAAIAEADTTLSNGYNQVLGQIGSLRVAPQFNTQVATILHDPDLALSGPMQQRLTEIVNQQITNRVAPGTAMSAEVAKRADANLGMLARGYAGSQDGDQRMLSRAIREVQTVWRDNIRANATPEQAATLDELNRAFANFVRVERAAASTGAREGVFSPAQLQSAVRATDTSARHGNFAQGRALMQDLTDAGQATLSQTVPNSGTVDRALIAAAMGGGAAGANEYFGGPGYLSALALSPLLYSRAGSRYAVGDLIPGQQSLAEIIRNAAPYGALAGGAAAEQRRKQ